MSTIVKRPLRTYSGCQTTRRDFFLSLSASLSAMAWAPTRVMGQSGSLLPIPVSTLNHISLSASYLQFTAMWYQKVFGLPIVYFQNSPVTGSVYILRIGAGPSYIALTQKLPADPSNPYTTIEVPFRKPDQPIWQVRERPTRPHCGWGVRNFDADRLVRALGEHHVWPVRARIREGTAELKFEDPDGFSLQFADETSCGGAGYLGDMCGSTKPVRLPEYPPPIAVSTLNHVTLVVPDVQRSLGWYQKLTDMRIQTYQEAKGGPRTAGYQGPPIPILRIGAGPQHLALIEGKGPLGFRPRFGLGIEGFDLDQVRKRLTEHGVTSQIRMREGITRELLLEDPDGAQIQLSDASHCGGGGALGNICDPRRRPIPGSR